MDSSAAEAWQSLDKPWHRAFEQAWLSWTEGDLGIGAVLAEPATGEIVAAGRNRVNGRTAEANTISGNFMAHAEMNVFAAMDRFRADGLHLYTTLEPCFMCAATTVFLHVEHVHYAVDDEYFDGLNELWDQHPYPRRHKPDRTGPLPEPLAAFARVLPLVAQARFDPQDSVFAKADEARPAVMALARELVVDGTLEAISNSNSGGVVDALSTLWPRLPGN